jgi:hypothetical protein
VESTEIQRGRPDGADASRCAIGLCYWQVGRPGKCLRAGKTRSQKNACKSGRIPPVGCTLCSAAFCKSFSFHLLISINQSKNSTFTAISVSCWMEAIPTKY